jgi:hypothetical protein
MNRLKERSPVTMQTTNHREQKGRLLSLGEESLTLARLLLFFIPLGFSASLTALSHVIINGTLARGSQAEVIIASYAIAFSIFLIMERPVYLLRQTTSALVKDRRSYRAMLGVTSYVVVGLVIFSAVIAFTPVGVWFFSTLFDAQGEYLDKILNAYRVLLFVSIFSAYRCLYQGIIINRLQTKWLTIGMVIRLSVMAGVAWFLVWADLVHSAAIGSMIFLAGMVVEYLVSVWKGRKLLHELPEKKADHLIDSKSKVFRFYRPLLFSGGLAVLIMPAVNGLLGQTIDVTLSIASFALGMSILGLALSFFMYLHQIVLQFYNAHARDVMKWSGLLSFMPASLIALFSYTPFGLWFLTSLMGASDQLSEATLWVLKVMLIKALLFPLVDFCNGILMLRNQTSVMVPAQIANVSITLLLMALLMAIVPEWNGMAAALAVSIGVLAELLVISIYIWRNKSLFETY